MRCRRRASLREAFPRSVRSLGAPERGVGRHMFERSIVTKTGQLWKFYLAYALMLPAVLLTFGATLVSEQVRPWAYIGVPLFTLAGFVVLFITIRCPLCGARWFWLAASPHDQRRVRVGRVTASLPVCVPHPRRP